MILLKFMSVFALCLVLTDLAKIILQFWANRKKVKNYKYGGLPISRERTSGAEADPQLF